MIIPISIAPNGRIEASDTQLEHVEFAALGVTEGCIEEFLRKNIGSIFDEEEEETLLIVGQQVVNAKNARNDLVALDAAGNLVLIEIKRDATDIQSRLEAFEFQAIRYAASLATIKTVDDLVERIFARYIKKREAEFTLGDLTPEELGKRIVTKFLVENNADRTFNARQRIMLVASAFDDQTLSAVAWMNANGIDISCISLSPVKQGDLRYLMCEKLIPARKIEDYLVGFNDPVRTNDTTNPAKGPRSRTFLPRMDKLVEWKIVNVGDTLRLKGQDDSEAVVVDAKSVRYKGQVMSYNKWGQSVTKWSSICIYDWAITGNGQTLTEQRAERMKADEQAALAAAAAPLPA